MNYDRQRSIAPRVMQARQQSRPAAVLVVLVGCLLFPNVAHAAGNVVGHIDGVRLVGGQYQLSGWACQQGVSDSIDIQVFANASAFDAPKGTFVLSGVANLPNEPAVAQACRDQDGRHRFQVALPSQILATYQGRPLYVHGIRKQDGVANALLNGSGTIQYPKPPLQRTVPDSFPPIPGNYVSSAQHPRVFMTRDDLNDLVRRINTPRSFSEQSFARLAAQIKADLAAKVDWDAAYSGCDIDIYLHGFSYEPRGGYASEVRNEEQLSTEMKVRSGSAAPAGAAVVASRAALYAAIAKAGASLPSGAPASDQAAALAKRILLAWATRGFRDEHGNFRRSSSQYCTPGQPPSPVAVTLQIARGVVYSVQAQDLLQGMDALKPDEEARLNNFHSSMHEVIRSLSNEEFDYDYTAKAPIFEEAYNNQFACHLAGLIATARLLDDKAKLLAVLYGGEGDGRVRLPWTKLFNYVLYGVDDRPLLKITPNTGDDALNSHPAYSSPIVAAGEVNDRYRNSNPLQGIGYPMATLEWLLMSAESLRIAGLDAYAYRGAHQQSIELSTAYYACYAKWVGFKKTVSADNARACPDYEQYVGRIVNDVETVVLIGSYRFPRNAAITEVEAAAKTEAARDPIDAIRFGRWRD